VAKIKLTKNELKHQRDSLKMYKRYLPTLQLKKQQLQIEIRGIEARRIELEAQKKVLEAGFGAWIGVFGESRAVYGSDGRPLLTVDQIRTRMGNIAGVEIPVFEGADFALADYDLYAAPLWVDAALERLKKALLLDLESQVLSQQAERLGTELRVTSQRVNLFDKVKIPEAEEAIRRIGIYLGDEQTAQVVRGKFAKKKVAERSSQ